MVKNKRIKKISVVKELLSCKGVGVFPTDTIYGLIGLAKSQSAVERIYQFKGRDFDKPLIILISELASLAEFGVVLSRQKKSILESYWPGAVTFILPLNKRGREEFEYLHRGTNKLAFRWGSFELLNRLIKEVGPVVAPSANPQSLKPAENIDRAKEFFGDDLDFYFDYGELKGEASTLIDLTDKKPRVLRQGVVVFEK